MWSRTAATSMWSGLRPLLRPRHNINHTYVAHAPTKRPQHVRCRYYGFGPQYQRFQRGSGGIWLYRWAQQPTFYYQVAGLGAAGGLFYVANLEVVPVSGRRRFNVVGQETEESLSKQMYAEVMREYGDRILPAADGRTQLVRRALRRLIPASGLQDQHWEVHVIDSPEKNAFVIPGGKVFVFSGILPICGTEDGLAAVLGHEIAHNVAHHAAERMSQGVVLIPLIYVLEWTFGVPGGISQMLLDLAFQRPGSRKQETEADYIGLMMMAQSCYDPKAAVGVWERMERAEQAAPPQFLSTHPSSHNRRERIMEWLPEAENKRAESDCQSTLGYANEFKKAFGQMRW